MSTPVAELRGPVVKPRSARLLLISVLGLLGIVVLRIHESVPALQAVKPAALCLVTLLPWILVTAGRERWRAAWSHGYVPLLVLYVAWLGLSVPAAFWLGLAVSTYQTLLIGCGVGIALALAAEDQAFETRLFAWLVALAALLGLLLMVRGVTIGEGRIGFPGGSLDSNDIAAVMAACAPLTVFSFVRSRLVGKVVAMGSCAVLCVAIIKTGSRGGTVALGAGLLALVMAQPPRRWVPWLVGVAIAGAAGWRLIPEVHRARMEAVFRGEEDYNETSYSGRKQIWRRSLLYIARDPVFGVGVGNFTTAEGRHAEDIGRPAKWSTAHNSFIQSTTEGGIPAGLLYGTLVFAPIVLLRRSTRLSAAEKASLVASLIAYVTACVFVSHAYNYFFFGLVGLCAHVLLVRPERSGSPVVR
jgi:O-antigen ligase